MAGRKPKPTRIKELAGWPGHHKKPVGEPQPPPDLGSCPAHVRDLAKAEWERLNPELRNLGLLTVVDRAALEAYCIAYGRWREAETALKKSGGPVGRNRFGERVVNPAFTVAHKSMEMVRKIAVEFGFTPSSRSRITSKPPEAEDPEEEYFDDRRGSRPTKLRAV